MGKTTTQGDDINREVETEAVLEAALEAGFTGSDYVMPEEAGPATPSTTSVNDEKTPLAVEELLGVKEPPVVPVTKEPPVVPVVKEQPVVEESQKKDEWEGVSDVIKQRFETMASDLERVTNIANSASGRASKLQSQIQQNLAKPTEAPKPTSQQIHEAMVDKTKRDALREEWPDFAAAFDEIDTTISNAVGSQIDTLRTEFAATQQQYVADQIKNTLDMRHPGWENTVINEDFKNWVYEGGPTIDERTKYENMLGYAQSLKNNSPTEARTLFTQANTLYTTLLSKYPIWAGDKGSLYGDPSGEAAIKLLDMHKTVQQPDIQNIPGVPDEYALQQVRNKQRLAANISPTSGADRQLIVDPDDDVEAAFKAGFNS